MSTLSIATLVRGYRERFTSVSVALCVNDDEGEPTFRLAGVHIVDGEGGIDLAPVTVQAFRDHPLCHRPHGTTDVLHVGHLVLRIGSYAPHSIAWLKLSATPWDVVTMSRADVRRLIQCLLDTRDWQIVDAPTDSDLLPAQQLRLA